MAIDFPATPADGDIYEGYVYDATKGVWRSIPDDAASVISSPIAPAGAKVDNLWFDTNDGTLFIRFDDGDTVQWVEAKNAVNYYANSVISSLESRIAALEARATLVEQQPIISGQIGSISSPSGAQKIPFDEFWVQRGITYDSSTRRFTVPTAGKYRITFNPFTTTNGTRVTIGVNNDAPNNSTAHRGHIYHGNTGHTAHSIDTVVQLNANDYVVYYLHAGTIYNNTSDRFNQFSIERIGD